jgi:hypothetical protein
MNRTLKNLVIVFLVLFSASAAQATDYYISPSGSGSACTIGSPCSLAAALGGSSPAGAGDTIYARGGTYDLSSQVNIGKNGSTPNYIKLFNYPGETPVFDGANNSSTAGYAIIRGSDASWWYFKGLEFKNSPGSGIRFSGSSHDIIIEFCNIHHNVRLDGNGAGIEFDNNFSNILILNNDVHHQSINQPSGTGGDGIGLYDGQQTGNVIRGNRVWRNHDDGMDLWNSANVLVEGNWSWENGYNDNLQITTGNGTGFKLGGAGTGDGNHIVRNNLAWRNTHSGFDDNSADIPMVLYNNTGYANAQAGGNNFAFYTAIANVLRNNLAYSPNSQSFASAVVQDHNSWNLPVTVNSSDFVTLDFTANLGARQSDGSLPTSNFLNLVAGSDLIDRGVNVGLPYNGSAPDLGAYEYTNSVASVQAPSNLVVQP